MPHFETNESYYQEALDGTPDVRPPQLNMTICGCRCGCGCPYSGESEGGSGDDEGAATRTQQSFEDVPSMTSADQVVIERSRGVQTMEQPSPLPFRGDTGIQRIESRFGGFIMTREGFRPDYFAIGSEEHQRSMITRRLSASGHVKTPASTTNEPHDSDDHSSASGGEVLRVPDVRYGSPGPGVGGWVVLADYHFHCAPLRLTPQREYCRGLVTAHFVVHDDMTDHEHYNTVFPKRLRT